MPISSQCQADKARFRNWLNSNLDRCCTYSAAEPLMSDACWAIEAAIYIPFAFGMSFQRLLTP